MKELGTITEESATFAAAQGKITTKMGVFYNPVMKRNRDITVLLLNAVENTDMRIADPLAGSGVRAIRLAKELSAGKIKEMLVNDGSPVAVETIKKNLSLNEIEAQVSQTDAAKFLLSGGDFDYIDIDPFGYPGPFLDSACRRLKGKGILAVTATDTSALAGTAKRACRRKYWAEPTRDEQMHETGLRILIRRVQLIGAMYEKALVPVLSYAHQHYYRVFFVCQKGNIKVDEILAQHGMHHSAGPLWLGPLGDAKLAEKMAGEKSEQQDFLAGLAQEYAIGTIGFFDIPTLCREEKLARQPSLDEILEALGGSKTAARTHFADSAVKVDAGRDKIIAVLRSLQRAKHL